MAARFTRLLFSSLLAVVTMPTVTVAQAQYGLAIHFVNATDTTNMYCEGYDQYLVQSQLFRATGFRQRRHLRADEWKEQQEERQLAGIITSCTGCGLYCRFARPGCARLLGAGRRRDLQTTVPTSQCAGDINTINTRLDQLLPQVTAPCQRFLKTQRRYTCELMTECDISHVSLWNAANDTRLIQKFPLDTGTTPPICFNTSISFQAVTNFYVGKVQFNLFRQSNQQIVRTTVDYEEPYFLTKSNGTDLVEGLTLALGWYKLVVWSQGQSHKPKTLHFEVKRC